MHDRAQRLNCQEELHGYKLLELPYSICNKLDIDRANARDNIRNLKIRAIFLKCLQDTREKLLSSCKYNTIAEMNNQEKHTKMCTSA